MTQRILKYFPSKDGNYQLVVEGAELSGEQMQLLDNGFDILVDVKVHDPYKITTKQRKKIFALLNDIESATGQPREYLRSMFQDYVKVVEGYEEKISLSNCDKETASKVIDVIIQWVFIHNIPLNHKTSDLMKNDNYFIYLSTINRQCIICGTPNSDIAHLEAVGSGRDRRTHDHTNHHVLALCRRHHNEQHRVGVKTFNQTYHLENSWVKVTPEINKKLQGR